MPEPILGRPYHATIIEAGGVYTISKPTTGPLTGQLVQASLAFNQDLELSFDSGSTWFTLPAGVRSVNGISCRSLTSFQARRAGGGAVTITGVFE